jgi:phasin
MPRPNAIRRATNNEEDQARRFADKSTKAARETVESGVSAAEDAARGAEQSFSSSLAGMRELNIKLIDIAQANAEAVFDLAHEIASAEAPSDLAAIWSAHARRQFEMMTKQPRELTDLGQKLASRSTEPVTRSVNEALRRGTT